VFLEDGFGDAGSGFGEDAVHFHEGAGFLKSGGLANETSPTQIRGRRRLCLELPGDPLSLGNLSPGGRRNGKREAEGDGNSVGEGLAVAEAVRTRIEVSDPIQAKTLVTTPLVTDS
jgi:hypothetical protein